MADITIYWSPGYGPKSLCKDDVMEFKRAEIKYLDRAAVKVTADMKEWVLSLYHIAAIRIYK